jgi:tricorn protease
MKLRASLLIVFFTTSSAVAMEGYYRSPSLRGDKVVFTAEGDLWLLRLDDPRAERLTTHPSLETDASISPDGDQIAFISDYEGAFEAYIMPISGGVPKRLTYENDSVVVQGWTSGGLVLYSTSSRVGPPNNWTLKTVNPATLEVEPIPLADAKEGAIDAKTEYVYFTQYGLQWTLDNANTYRGGSRGKLWRYRLGSNREASRLGQDHSGSARRPMVHGDKLYFLSDASGRDNLWSMDLDGANVAQITRHEKLSIRGADIDGGRVIYQLGADLYILDFSNFEPVKLDIQLPSDHPSLREAWVKDPMKYATSARFAGDFEKVVITARGKAAIAGIDQERLVTVGTPPRSRMRRATLSRDGQWVYAISDSRGELELWRYDATGASTAEQLTEGGNSLRVDFFESPNGKWIAHGDGRGGLWLLNTRTKRNKQIVGDSDGWHQFSDMDWAPDSKLLAVTHHRKGDARRRILLLAVEKNKQAYVTSDKYESWAPIFSHDGKWLYFLSNRHFESLASSVWADRDFGPGFDRRTEIFAHALTNDAEFPFAVPSELSPKKAEDNEVDKPKDENVEFAEIKVEWDGLSSRVWQVPMEPGNYTDIVINDKFLYVLTTLSSPKSVSEIRLLKLEPQPQSVMFTDNTVAMDLSDDGSKLFVQKMTDDLSEMFIVAADEEFPTDVSKKTVLTQEWQFNIDPKLEWEQMFHDAWLMHRELFFDPDMRGLDWVAIKDKYTPMVKRVTERHELNDVLAQMMGELNALHSPVSGGDFPSDPDAPSPAVLGAELMQTQRGVEITHIYRHDREVPAKAPPLAKPGVDAADGDIIEAINGIEVPTLDMVHRSLRNRSGKQVLLRLRRGREEIKTVVVPVDAEQAYAFRYGDWVNNNRRKVETADSDLGYLHIKAMGPADVAAFARDFYASDNKKGMVIDVRRNDGGNVDSWIIDRLLRKSWMFWTDRFGELEDINMQNTFRGHLTVIADEGTYSDGETFTAAIKKLDIAPVIGKRTAGAGVWLSGTNYLTDFGRAGVAEFPVYDMDGQWIVEGHGVAPTIEVDNLPHATYEGYDAQLQAAIQYLQQKIEEEPIPTLDAKPFPEYGHSAQDIVN